MVQMMRILLHAKLASFEVYNLGNTGTYTPVYKQDPHFFTNACDAYASSLSSTIGWEVS